MVDSQSEVYFTSTLWFFYRHHYIKYGLPHTVFDILHWFITKILKYLKFYVIILVVNSNRIILWLVLANLAAEYKPKYNYLAPYCELAKPIFRGNAISYNYHLLLHVKRISSMIRNHLKLRRSNLLAS